MVGRVWHGSLAALVAAALLLQFWIAIRQPGTPHATVTGILAGGSFIERLIRVLSFFTIQSNVLCMVTAASLVRAPRRDGRWWRILQVDAIVGITVTGVVYSAVLAGVHQPRGWQQVSTNTVFHYLVPIATVLGWLLFGPRPRVDVRVVGWSLAWPAAWFGYTLIRGAVWSWYPYPFVDVSDHGWARVLLNAAAVTVVLGAVASALWLADRRLPPTVR